MAFVRLVLRGDAEYHRINWAKVKSATFANEDEDEASSLPAEADHAPLLKALPDSHREPDVETMMTCINPQRLKHVASALNRKSKKHKRNATIQLHIRKMDNTTFALVVPKNATMAEVKQVMQNKFDSSGCSVSWPHVWGNFCLGFNNQKLLDSGKQLHQLGIGDCHELHFMRHITISSGQWDYERRGFFTNLVRKRGLLTNTEWMKGQ